MTDERADDIVLASAARFLVDGGEDAANALLSCSLEFWESGDTSYVDDETHQALLTSPPVDT